MKRKRGTKSEPLCGLCQQAGHNRTSCPTLARQLLAAATKHSSVEELSELLASGKALKLNAGKRPQRTLKRAGGKRGKGAPAAKTERGAWRKRQNRRREAARRPKAKKRQQPKPTLKEVAAALRALRGSGWLWRSKRCPCGDRLVQCPLKASVKRGHGRVYLRCAGCRKWYDVLARSYLPVLKMPLPVVWRAMGMYFAHLQPPTLQDAACSLGLSGNSAGVLGRLWRALRGAEARCMDAELSARLIAGLLRLCHYEMWHGNRDTHNMRGHDVIHLT